MKLRVPNEMLFDLSKNQKLSQKNREILKMFITSWADRNDCSVINHDSLNKEIFSIFTKTINKKKGRTRKDRYLRRQLETLNNILENPEGVVVKRLEALEESAKRYFSKTEHYILFQKKAENLYPYLVTDVEYTRATPYNPAHVTIKLSYIKFDANKDHHIVFYRPDIMGGVTLKKLLDSRGFYIENKKLFEQYEKDIKTYYKYKQMIGIQFWASGMGETLREKWYQHELLLEVEEERSKVILDIFQEVDDDSRVRYRKDDILEMTEVVNFHKVKEHEEYKEFRVPVHLVLCVFHLKSDEFMGVHVSNLEQYEYTPELIDKLVLPKTDKELIHILITGTKDVMEDIVQGKTGGIIVIATGPPGTGKTLTAEVYSEVVKKPLYVVQSSQLGVDVEKLEENLDEILTRASRWNAILLIDEADVYVHERGDDLVQNSVVGIFLRLLEYYKGILFMTSNRTTIVDDAIVSRATAHIRYDTPDKESSIKIWKILSEQFKIKLSESQIQLVYKAFPDICGRDIKNLLKLAGLLSKRSKTKVDVELIKYVSNFLDVGGIENDKK